MKIKVNAYLATLLITVLGAGVALLIIRLSNDDTIPTDFAGSAAQFSDLQQSILNQPD